MRRPTPLLFPLLALLAMMTDSAAQTETGRALAAHPVAAAASLGSTEKNWLVAIGVDQFKDTGVQPLRFCVADARALYEYFTSTGFVPAQHAYLLISGAQEAGRAPARVNVLKAIKYVAASAAEDSTIIVHFSGHGFEDRQGTSYLLPEDGDTSLLEETAVAVTWVNKTLAEAKTKRKILIVDACRTRTGKAGAAEGVSDAFIQALRASSGQVTMASCGADETSYEMSEGGHGVYTHYLLEGLKGAADADGAGLITLSSLQAYVARAVPGWCQQQMKEKVQQPWMSGEMSLPIPLALKGALQPTPRPPVTPVVTPAGPSELDAIDAYGKAEAIDGNSEYTAKRKADAWRVYLDKYRPTGYQVDQAQERQIYWQNWRPPVTPRPRPTATPVPPQPARPQRPASGERFTVSSNGVITDCQQDLDWCEGPDKDTTYDAAVSWVRSLSVDGGGWRMPTREELKILYDESKQSWKPYTVFKTTGKCIWSEEYDSSYAWLFYFISGDENKHGRYNSLYNRAFAVRSRR